MKRKLAKDKQERRKRFDAVAVKVLLASRESNMTELAKEIGISGPYMYHLLHGKRNVNGYLKEVADHLGVPESIITKRDPSVEE